MTTDRPLLFLLPSASSLKMSGDEKEKGLVSIYETGSVATPSQTSVITKSCASRQTKGGVPPSVLRLPDPSDDKAIRSLNWSFSAPEWRIATPGLIIEGKF